MRILEYIHRKLDDYVTRFTGGELATCDNSAPEQQKDNRDTSESISDYILNLD